jgi:hypothetical protein
MKGSDNSPKSDQGFQLMQGQVRGLRRTTPAYHPVLCHMFVSDCEDYVSYSYSSSDIHELVLDALGKEGCQLTHERTAILNDRTQAEVCL